MGMSLIVERMRRQDQQSRVFSELSSLVFNIIRSPPSPIQFSDDRPPVLSPLPLRRRPVPAMPQITPAGFASLMLGISLTLMLCGTVTFFIGFILMPWVIGFAMVLYFVGFVWSLSVLGRSIVCYATSSSCSSPPSLQNDVQGPAWKFM